ncbi:MAG: alpha/beta fold hydrolase, partial [Candidatus Tectomicrobia bacterium]
GLMLTLLLFEESHGAVTPGTFRDAGGQVIHREFLPHSKEETKKIELFWTKPEGSGAWPVVLFVHGHQIGQRHGGEVYVHGGRLRRMVYRGYVAAAVSQPGYGNSDGPPDFCGPFTQDAVLRAIQFLRDKPFVHPNKVALYGVSRGAIVSAMVAAQDPRLAAVILVAGMYDLDKGYPTGLHGLDTNIAREAGISRQAFNVRSAVYHAEKIRAPVLLLHGASDDRFAPTQVEAFARQLMAHGVPVRIKIVSGAGHGIPIATQYKEIYPFLLEHLR